MVIAKKIKFGKTADLNSWTIVDPIDGKLYIPVSGYTKAEISTMWSNVTTLEIPNKFAQFGLIGAGATCYNPGYGTTLLADVPAYAIYCDSNFNPNCVMPHVDGVLGRAGGSVRVCYLNSNGDGFFFNAGSNPTFRLNGGQVFNWSHGSAYMLGLSSYDNNYITQSGTLVFFFVTSDDKVGMFRINGTGASNSYLQWMNDTQAESFFTWIETLEPLPEDEDPYSAGGISEPSDDDGSFSRDGEDVDVPTLPTLSASDAGFITLYNPSLAQLNSLATYLWSTDIASVIQKLFANPMDAIIGLSVVPVAVPNGGARNVKIGNVDTGVSMNVALQQYVEVQCGSVTILNFFGGYLDYSPHTKVDIYLPYIGVRALSADDVMGKTLTVVYHVDILSGACCAYIKVGGTVLYTFIGQCSASIPITGGDMTNVINGVLNIAGAIGTTIATGGASAPTAISSIASTALNGGLKPEVEKSGSISGVGGFFGVQKPYLIITTPRQCLPSGQNKMIGYPSFINEKLSTLSGYTEINEIHLENIPATGAECDEIVSLLKGGVII